MMRRLLPDTRGNVALEFALVAPIFALMVIGLADFGLMTRERSTLDAAVRAGLQVILTDPGDTSQAEALALEMAPDAEVEAIVACECPDGAPTACNTACSGQLPLRFVTMTAMVEWQMLFPWPGLTNPFVLDSLAEGRTQ